MKCRGVLLLVMLSAIAFAQDDSLIISEIMFYPFPGNNEFIELYNLSSTESIDLLNYKIKYYSSSPDTIISSGYGTILQPHQYAVILEGDYDFANGIYNIPPSALILKINNNAFGSSGMANTASRPVWLLSPSGDSLDSYFYSADNSASITDEKKSLVKDTSGAYWANSLMLNGTPGYRNSVMQYEKDLASAGVYILPVHPVEGDDIEIFTRAANRGLLTAAVFTINFYNDADFDSTASPSELIYSETGYDLAPGDTVIYSAAFYNCPPGDYRFIIKIDYDQDEDTLNNTAVANVTVSPGLEYNSVIINEIMYAPADGEPEWIELFNNSGSVQNIRNWKIGDASSSVYVTRNECILNPGDYIIIAKDSSVLNYYPFNMRIIKTSLPALNNTGDAVVLTDSLGRICDSLYYNPYWGGLSDKSLERILPSGSSLDPVNWGTCKNRFKGTPGFKNSLRPKTIDAVVNSFRTMEKYAVTGQTVTLKICCRNNGSAVLSGIPLNLFRDINADSSAAINELIHIFTSGTILPGDSIFFFFSLPDFQPGNNFYIAEIDYDDEDTCNNTGFYSFTGIEVNFKRNDIAINEIMHSPENEPEWVELFNTSSSLINLKNFRIADKSDTVLLSKQNYFLDHGEYVIISGDSILLEKRKVLSGFIKCSLPALNNTGDRFIFIDSLERVIDSLYFHPSWGGNNGCSIERKNPFNSSTDSTNWGTSINKYGGTAGYINSLTAKSYDSEITGISFNPSFPIRGDTVGISIRVKNRGRESVPAELRIYENNILIESASLYIENDDSLEYSCSKKIYGIDKNENIYAEIITQNDQDTSNNYSSVIIKYGYPRYSIVVNEISYNPGSGEPEWLELYNRSDNFINIKNWSIGDLLTSPSEDLIPVDYIFPPRSYLIISADSSVKNCYRIIPSDILVNNIPNLNNDRDGIILRDDRQLMIDSLMYSGNYEHNSLERISTEISSRLTLNWGNCIDYESGTPGRINSITVKDYDLSAGQIDIDPLYPVPGDTVTITASVKNLGIKTIPVFTCSFIINDSLFSSVTGNPPAPGDSCVIYCPAKINSLDSNKNILFRVEFAGDSDPYNNIREREIIPGEKNGSIIINEIMYDPAGDSPEWVELYNPSDNEYNLKNWMISDILPSPAKGFISSSDILIRPGEYLVISQDSSLADYFPGVNKFIISHFGSLSSTGDGIVLYDYRDGIIDSVKFKPEWGGKNGRSLERISPEKISSDPLNWTTSLSSFMATPGEINSVCGIPVGNRLSLIINEILYDPGTGNCEFVEMYNRGENPVDIGGWRLGEETNFNRISDTSYIIDRGEFFVFAADSLIEQNYPAGQIGKIHFAYKSSLGLSNSGGVLMLKDIYGNIIDSLYYNYKLHNRNFALTKNRSLERISPVIESCITSNWSTSVSLNGATPGIKNSIYTIFEESRGGVKISPNPFSPDNDGWEDFGVIAYSLKTSAPQIRVRIFDSSGRLVRELADNLSKGSEGSLIFDGRDSYGKELRMGIYIMLFEASSEAGTEAYKIPFVIARKL